MNSSDSLRGQNKDGRIAGVGSSPTRSTFSKSQRTNLWNRLRAYDRKIDGLDKTLVLAEKIYCPGPLRDLREKRRLADGRRQAIRHKMKYGRQHKES